MRKLLFAFAAVLSISFAPKKAAAQNTAPTKLMILPFQNMGGTRGQDYLQLQFAATVAERLENIPSYSVIAGPMVLTPDMAKLMPGRNANGKMAHLDLARANALAQSLDASVFITGHYTGSEWKWSLTTEVYAAQTNGPKLIGNATINGDLTTKITTAHGHTRTIVDIHAIHNLLSQTVADSMHNAGLPDTDLVKTALQTTSTKDSWAFLQLGLAYIRYFNPPDVDHHRSALEIAQYAVLVDPNYSEAQRLYSVLLQKKAETEPDNQAKALAAARLHYEIALAQRPKDTRILIPLAQLELQAKNESIAKDYLDRAILIHPQDSEPHFWLAQVNLKLGKSNAAITEFEKTRNLSPTRLDARRELVKLYNQQLRYLKAAKELGVIVKIEPQDLQAAFDLAAVLRAANKNTLAIQAYKDAEERFPTELRFAKFRANIEQKSGDLFIWVQTIAEGKRTTQTIDNIRKIFQLAANNTAMDFSLNGKEACANDRGASSMLLAQLYIQLFLDHLQILRSQASIVEEIIENCNDVALTTNERDDAQTLLVALKQSERDNEEIQMQMGNTDLRLVQKKGCKLTDENIRITTIDNLKKQNLDWRVNLPAPKQSTPTFEIPTSSVRMIHFYINNTTNQVSSYLFIDGKKFGVIAGGQKKKEFTTNFGNHTYCLAEKPADCEQAGNIRYAFFSEGLILERK